MPPLPSFLPRQKCHLPCCTQEELPPFRHGQPAARATSPIWHSQTVEARVERLSHLRYATVEARVSLVISTEEAAATEWRNLLYKGVGSQIPPLASLGRDDKRGERLGRLTRWSGPPRASAPTVGMTGGITVEARAGHRLRSARPPRRRAETAFFGPNYSKLYEGPKTPLICGT